MQSLEQFGKWYERGCLITVIGHQLSITIGHGL